MTIAEIIVCLMLGISFFGLIFIFIKLCAFIESFKNFKDDVEDDFSNMQGLAWKYHEGLKGMWTEKFKELKGFTGNKEVGFANFEKRMDYKLNKIETTISELRKQLGITKEEAKEE